MTNDFEGRAPMRIGLLNPCYWPEVQRGSERVIHELVARVPVPT